MRRFAFIASLLRVQRLWLLGLFVLPNPVAAQSAPGPAELQAYRGLHAAAAKGDAAEIERLARSGSAIDARDGHQRTPLHVAVFMKKPEAVRALLRLGADANALEAQQYDIVTIAAVANDVPMLARPPTSPAPTTAPR
jgi:hypothetical protein